jgi:hypothetical protein
MLAVVPIGGCSNAVSLRFKDIRLPILGIATEKTGFIVIRKALPNPFLTGHWD